MSEREKIWTPTLSKLKSFKYICFILSELLRGKKLLHFSTFKFQHSNAWMTFLPWLFNKMQNATHGNFYHMEPLIWVGLQFIHSFSLNERQYYYHHSMTTTWHAFDYIMLSSEWPSSSTNQWNPTGSDKICMLNTSGWSNNLFKFSIISWRMILSDICIK